jgi:hypothetical protein
MSIRAWPAGWRCPLNVEMALPLEVMEQHENDGANRGELI